MLSYNYVEKLQTKKYTEKMHTFRHFKKKLKNMPAAELWAPGILLTFHFATNCS